MFGMGTGISSSLLSPEIFCMLFCLSACQEKKETLFIEKDGKLYAYNYVDKTFNLTNEVVDPMTFHEFPESELEKNIKLKTCFKNKKSSANAELFIYKVLLLW